MQVEGKEKQGSLKGYDEDNRLYFKKFKPSIHMLHGRMAGSLPFPVDTFNPLPER